MFVHIVPTVPPDLNGLGDYCFHLSRNWPDKNVSWGCLALRVPEGASQIWPDAKLSNFEPSHKGLITALEALPVEVLILHYVNYAYHPKGVPSWLPGALAEWRKSHPQGRVVVMFHELWAVEWPWRRSFWVKAAAQSIVAQLARECDAWITSCQQYFEGVVAVGGPAHKGTVIPIATNIEPATPIDFERPWPLFEGGKLKIAVFGLATTRNTALATHAQLLRELCAQNLVEHISVLGQKPDEKSNQALEATIKKIGPSHLWHRSYDLSPGEVSLFLKQHDLGIVKETVPLLTKSGVYAALCSHGVIPICAASHPTESDVSPFLINNNSKQIVFSVRDQNSITNRKQNVQRIATTSLVWSSVSTNWIAHMQRFQ